MKPLRHSNKLKSSNKTSKTAPTSQAPALRDTEIKRLLALLEERAPWLSVIERSYILSRFWAWWSKVELQPKVKIPVPRFLSHRDP